MYKRPVLAVQAIEISGQGGSSGADHVITEDDAVCCINYSPAASLFRLKGSPDPPSACVPGRHLSGAPLQFALNLIQS